MKVSVIIPAYNEENNLGKVIADLQKHIRVEHEIIVVNDHSTDNTKKVAQGIKDLYKNVSIIDNRFNRGFANALRAGFEAANCDLIVPVMADSCDDPLTINKMHQKISEGFDIVCGSRYIKYGRKKGGPFLKTFFTFFASRTFKLLTGMPTHDITNAFKMYRRSVIDSLDLGAKSFEISMEIPVKAYLRGYRIAEVPTVWVGRTAGKSSFKVAKLIPVYLKLYIWAVKNYYYNKFILIS